MSKEVLIVDDADILRQLLGYTVQRVPGVTVTEAGDGIEALKKLSEKRYDLVIVDLNMPLMDGYTLIQRMRADPQCLGTKIIVLTTESGEETERKVQQAGAHYYLRKPIDPKDLQQVVGQVFSGTR